MGSVLCRSNVGSLTQGHAMSLTPPSAQYIPPAPPPEEPKPIQQPIGTPDQYAYLRKSTPSFMASAAPAPGPTQTAKQTLIGS